MPPRLLSSRDIPQANSIDRVVELVRLLERDAPLSDFAHPRDRHFYFSAAGILGLLQGRALTPRGRGLATLEGAELVAEMRWVFEQSTLGSTWLEWQGVSSIDGLDATRAAEFLGARSELAPRTCQRRASTLKSWVQSLQAAVSGALRRPQQLSLLERREWWRWPDPRRFPHNEAGRRVRDVLTSDFATARDWLLVTGYSSMEPLLQLLAARPPTCARARLLLGAEPFSNAGAGSRAPRKSLPDEIRDHWLDRGVSVLLSSALLAVRDAVSRDVIEVRSAPPGRPIHAKVYVADGTVTIGSSNYTPSGLMRQSEANVRFTSDEQQRSAEAKNFAEGLWTLGEDFKTGFLQLLDQLLARITWQEVLARACAALLEGEWTKQYMRPELISDLPTPLWPHQLQGIAEAMWLLENVGAVLVADAAGSGKTRMGAWLVRAAFDRQYRFGFTARPSPLVVAPPAVVETWEERLQETHLPLPVRSHGPLSNSRSRRHRALLDAIARTELLAVDEAHNFLNASDRTFRLASHFAENTMLFTATPINRRADDLLSLVDLLGADNLSESSRRRLNRLRRRRHNALTPEELELIRAEIRRFTVRRTRAQLNEIVEAQPDGYRLPNGRTAQYPHHRAESYDCSCGAADSALAAEISVLADQLHGASRIPLVLRLPKHWQASERAYVDRVKASARALARYDVMDCLRSSRAALYEHIHGTTAAFERYVPGAEKPTKGHSGDIVTATAKRASNVPEWQLTHLDPSDIEPWLWESGAHAAACAHDERVYREIAHRVSLMTAQREEKKLAHLKHLASAGVVLAFDSHLISLAIFHREAVKAGLPVSLFTGEGGAGAKRRAAEQLGLDGNTDRLLAFCSDALSEGMNLQRASCVVHLDTPTVIRLAEQRAGRVDRMDSPHDAVTIWWPKDPLAFAPQRRDLLKERHRMVSELIGANLELPGDDNTTVEVSELATRANVEHDDLDEADALYDAFRGVRKFVARGGLVGPQLYATMKTSRVRLQSCVSAVRSSTAWAFFVVAGVGRRAPQWVFFESPRADPVHDLSTVSEALRQRLTPDTTTLPASDETARLEQNFVERLRQCEDELLPPRRRRALALLQRMLREWADGPAASAEHQDAYRMLRDWLFTPLEARREPYADPRGVADAWLALIRPRLKTALPAVRRTKKFWTLTTLAEELVERPIAPEVLSEAFAPVETLQPVEQRVVAMIVGVASGEERA